MEKGPKVEGEEERRQELQKEADALIGLLSSLDFNDPEAVLDWVCEYQEPSGISKGNETVLKIFAEHGYLPGMNQGEAFDGEDRDNAAHYVVGQALEGLRENGGGIHEVVHKFADEWKKKYRP